MEPTWQIYASVVVFGAGLALLLWSTIAHWRRPNPRFAKVPYFWVWGEEHWRGLVRSWLAIEIALALTIALIVYTLVVGKGNVRNDVSIAFLILIFLSMVCWITIDTWNQPKFLVPPYLRGEKGTWSSSWLAGLRK
jgi:hypothetical protein